ncbi:Uncharacterised protein [Vibrio cholerae]|nr:Uncharacterised protein [Vibrio cholerae]
MQVIYCVLWIATPSILAWLTPILALSKKPYVA